VSDLTSLLPIAASSSEDSVVALIVLPAALSLIMLSLGLTLTPADFKRVLVYPKGVGIGLGNLLLISPLLGFAVAELYNLEPTLACGLVLMAAAPGGTMANLLTHLAKGDTALSVTMTGVSSLLAVVTVPVYLSLSIDYFDAPLGDDISMGGVVVRVFLITIIPLSLGMYLRSRDPVRVIRLEPRFKKITFAVFAIVVAGAIASEFDVVRDSFTELALATLTLNVAAMTVSWTVARVARLSSPQSTAIALELGLHNSTLAIAVGASLSDQLATPAAVYSVFMFWTAGGFARLMYKRNQRIAAAATAAGEPAAEPARA
jgi:BASS family bile acid:Na+ symporter